MVGACELNFDAIGCRVRPLQHLMQEGARPAGCGYCVVTPWFADGQRSHFETPIPRAFERDDVLDRWQGAQVVER